jgi:hypothetical protein
MFSAVLNNRLTKFSDEFELITNAQADFRKGLSTNDNIFILHAPQLSGIIPLSIIILNNNT